MFLGYYIYSLKNHNLCREHNDLGESHSEQVFINCFIVIAMHALLIMLNCRTIKIINAGDILRLYYN